MRRGDPSSSAIVFLCCRADDGSIHRDQEDRNTLAAFQEAQALLLAAHRRLKDLPAAEIEHFWTVQGHRIEKHLHAAAVEVMAAFKVFSAAGLVADAGDRHMITEARRLVAEGSP